MVEFIIWCRYWRTLCFLVYPCPYYICYLYVLVYYFHAMCCTFGCYNIALMGGSEIIVTPFLLHPYLSIVGFFIKKIWWYCFF